MQAFEAISMAAVQEAARQSASIEEASARLGVTDFAALLADPALAQAWERGRLLRRLGELANTPICQEQVAKVLGMTPKAFQELLLGDIVARDVWRTGRQMVLVAAKNAVAAAAQRGEAYAVRAMERLLRTEAKPSSPGPADFGHLTLEDLSRATGIHRQQLYRWRDQHGLPQEADGGYSLPRFVAWLRKAGVGKVRNYRRKPGAVEARIIERVTAVIREELPL